MTDRKARAGQVASLYDHWSPTFERWAGATHQAAMLDDHGGPRDTNLALAQRAQVQPHSFWLDAGCGVGGPACDIAAEVPGLRVQAITISMVQAAAAARRVASAGLAERVAVQCADYHEMPFDNASFDGAWLFESACYAAPVERLLGELARVVRPGGRIYIKDLFLDGESPLLAEANDLDRFAELWALPPLRTLGDWAAAATAVGLAVEQAAPLPAASSVWYTGVMFTCDHEGLRLNPFGEQFFVPLTRLPVLWGELRLVV